MPKHSKTGTVTLCLICFLTISLGLVSCTSYTPNLWTGYDILNPNAEVRLNPLGFTEDGNAIVNQAFLIYVYELRQEVKKLRTELAKR